MAAMRSSWKVNSMNEILDAFREWAEENGVPVRENIYTEGVTNHA